MWIVDHLDDIESDLSAIHHVEDMWALPAARFVRLAERLVYYDGVIRVRWADRIAADQAEREQQQAGDLTQMADVIEYARG